MAVLPPDPVFCLKGNMGYVHTLCFPENDNRKNDYTSTVLAGTETGCVHFWDLETNRLRLKLDAGESIQCLHHVDDKLITQEKSGLIKLWEYKESNLINTEQYTCAAGYCKSVVLNDQLIVPQENNTVDAFDMKTMRQTKTFTHTKGNLGNVMCLQKVDLSGKLYVLAGYETGDIILWDFYTGKPCSHIKLRECITSLTFDTLTCRGICGNASNVLQIFTIDRNFNITLKCEISITNNGVNVVKLRPDRKIFISGGWDGRLRLFSWKSLRPLVVLSEHRGSLTDVAFSPTHVRLWGSNIMAASGADGMISLWNLYN